MCIYVYTCNTTVLQLLVLLMYIYIHSAYVLFFIILLLTYYVKERDFRIALHYVNERERTLVHMIRKYYVYGLQISNYK